VSDSTLERRSASLMWLMDGIAAVPATDVRVDDMTQDSRGVVPGSLFFALRGGTRHGLEFASSAVSAGASAVLWEPAPGVTPPNLPATVFVAPVPGLGQLVGRIADRFFGWPSSQLRIAGITGTNGKTTCAYLLAQCLSHLGLDAAYAGTLGFGPIGALQTPTHTTPDAVSVHRSLAVMRAAGLRAVAMEVSSHALDQGRVAGVRFHTAAFTNLTRDHLDYHGTMQAYGEAKARLFDILGLQQGVINVGDNFGRQLAQRVAGRLAVTAVWNGEGQFGWLGQKTLRATRVQGSPQGLSIDFAGSGGTGLARSRLVGRFNAENLLLVLAVLLGMDFPFADAIAAIEACAPPPGRMETLRGTIGKPLVVVDYAHTPDALANALEALRDHAQRKIWCIFGCGGDRDAGKRPLMGAVAAAASDVVIITDDNPRNEDPEAITRAILGGVDKDNVRVIHDRAAAIATAIGEAAADDIVLIAGKGHEDYQIYGASRREFSDRTEALRHLQAAV
jgi:UDP-N-acetylmuramoyl-L-alanyl-D-glutamate--2,6-diaminopimelate ligase